MTASDARATLQEFFDEIPVDVVDHLREDCHFYELDDVVEYLLEHAQKTRGSDDDMDLEGMSQERLIELFFDWFDAWTSPVSPLQWDKDAAAKVHTIRMRINICSTTGVDSTEGAGH